MIKANCFAYFVVLLQNTPLQMHVVRCSNNPSNVEKKQIGPLVTILDLFFLLHLCILKNISTVRYMESHYES